MRCAIFPIYSCFCWNFSSLRKMHKYRFFSNLANAKVCFSILIRFPAVSWIERCFHHLSRPIRSGVMADQMFTGRRGRWRVNASKQRMMWTSCSTGKVNTLAVLKALWFGSISLFIYLTSGVLEQPAAMLEQTSKNRSAVLRNISTACKKNANKRSSWHSSLANALTDFFNFFFISMCSLNTLNTLHIHHY